MDFYKSRRRDFILAFACVGARFIVGSTFAQTTPDRGTQADAEPKHVRVSTSDGGLIECDLYGSGDRGIVLAHGGRRSKENWRKQAVELAKLDFRVLAFNFRGFGLSRGPAQEHFDRTPFELDVLAAVGYLQKAGAKSICVVGGSFGAVASAKAAVAEPNLIDSLVLLGATPEGPSEKLTMRKLYIMTRDDANAAGRRLPALQAHFEQAPEPKRLLILDGSAHAQFIFETDDAERVMKEIILFLSPDTSPQAKPSKKGLGEEVPGH